MAPLRQPCRQFASTKGCRFGDKCKFSHDAEQKPETASTKAPRSPTSHQSDRSHRDWLRKISRSEGKQLSHFELDDIFQAAKDSLDSGIVEIQHEVIKMLADEQGLAVIRQVTKLRANELNVFALPFLQTLSHPATASSLLLEVHVETIYNTLYSRDGKEGKRFFEAIVTLAANMNERSNQTESIQRLLGHALNTFSRMLAINQDAAASDIFRSLAEQLEARTFEAFGDNQHRLIDNMNVDRIAQDIRINLGLAGNITGSSDEVKAAAHQLAHFQLKRSDGPGKLSTMGMRHDNDYEEITKISILPTAEEIWSQRPEYLPTKNTDTHHVPGVQGLLDRQFRLLREDTVGQLRDAARQAAMKARANATTTELARQGGQQLVMRTNSFSDAVITYSFFDPRHGLVHLVEFSQPRRMQGLSKMALKRAWTDSRDLAIDSCLCMLGPQQQATFCEIIDRAPSSTNPDEKAFHAPELDRTKLGRRIQSLDSDSKRAAIVVRALNLESQTVLEILGRQQTRSKAGIAHVLVEFPGVLLASFIPTLETLQEMSKNEALPFSDLLGPQLDIPPSGTPRAPEYTRSPAFEFDLSHMTKGEHARFSPQSPFDLGKFSRASGLDESQTTAFTGALSNEFALIQGPPGTGKSFVGVKLIQTLLQNRVAGRLGPIIVVCYTNHALDQILEHLLENKVAQLIRIGGRSKSEALANVNLTVLRQATQKTKAQRLATQEARRDIDYLVGEANDVLPIITEPVTTRALEMHLFENEPEFHGMFFDNDSVNADNAIDMWLAGGSRDLARLEKGDLTAEIAHTMTNVARRSVYDGWMKTIQETSVARIQSLFKQFHEAKRDQDLVQKETSMQCLKDAHIIGVTTTGLTKNIDILRKLLCKVLIVEEAGEIMEAHMLPALLPSLEHVIAIGDHQQLRPQIANYDLSIESSRGAQYALDVSLFERLIHPEPCLPSHPFSTLQTQRRMHPSISRLIRDTLYPKLVDDPSVCAYPEISSMRRRLYWFDHQNLEDTESEMSKSNSFEVGIVAALVTHLIKQGTYKISQIVVLTPYIAQLRKLRNRFANTFGIIVGDRDASELKAAGIEASKASQTAERASLGTGLRISTVDNYQGEESDIVIVSFVRSNRAGNVGFLKTTNRINVLLSRARHGMYIIGNASVARNAPMWSDVIRILESEGAIGPSFPLICPRHPETLMEICSASDFARFAPEGGCQLSCGQRLKCGHSVCASKCHSQHLHDATVCQHACQRKRSTCSHPCRKVCGQPCDAQCQALLQRIKLPCNHVVAQLKCHESQILDTIRCKEMVQKTVPGCGHKVKVQCCEDVAFENYRCSCGSHPDDSKPQPPKSGITARVWEPFTAW